MSSEGLLLLMDVSLIWQLPQCLSVHIQRLQMTRDGQPIKRQDHISFPETLCMDAFLYSKAGSPSLTKHSLCGGKQLPPSDRWVGHGGQGLLVGVSVCGLVYV